MKDIKDLLPEKLKESLQDEQVRIYLIAAVAAVVVAVYLTFGIIPQVIKVSRTSGQIRELLGNIDLVNSRVKQLDQMKKRLSDLQAELNSYAKGLPQQEEIPEFLEELSNIAKTSHVKILSITPSELSVAGKDKDDTGYYKEMSVLITAKSGYHQLGNFISSLEHSKRFINIEDLEIQSDSKTPREHHVKLNLKTYVAVGNK